MYIFFSHHFLSLTSSSRTNGIEKHKWGKTCVNYKRKVTISTAFLTRHHVQICYVDCVSKEKKAIEPSSEGLVVVAAIGPVAEDFTDITVGPLFSLAAVVGCVRWRVGTLCLRGTVLSVVEVKAVADVAE